MEEGVLQPTLVLFQPQYMIDQYINRFLMIIFSLLDLQLALGCQPRTL